MGDGVGLEHLGRKSLVTDGNNERDVAQEEQQPKRGVAVQAVLEPGNEARAPGWCTPLRTFLQPGTPARKAGQQHSV